MTQAGAASGQALSSSRGKLPAIGDAQLRKWFEEHREKYDEPTRYDFDEAALSGDNSQAAVEAFVKELNNGTPGDAKAGLRVSRTFLRWLLGLSLLLSAFTSTPAHAHEMTMAEMEVREVAPGQFMWQWSATNDKRPWATIWSRIGRNAARATRALFAAAKTA